MKQVELDYQLGVGAELCPKKDAMQNAISARLGYNPFRDSGTIKILTEVKEEQGELRASLRVRQPTSQTEGKRELSSKKKDCAELAAAMQLAIALAIDPFYSKAQTVAPASATPLEKMTAPAIAEPKPASVPWDMSAGVGLVGAAGVAPGMSLGLSADARALLKSFSVTVSGQAFFPSTATLTQYNAKTSLLTLKAAPCLHRGKVFGCAVLEFGGLRSTAENVSQPKTAWTPHFMAGARAGIDFPLTSGVEFQAHADLLARLMNVTLLVDNQSVWTSPFLALATGVSLRFQF